MWLDINVVVSNRSKGSPACPCTVQRPVIFLTGHLSQQYLGIPGTFSGIRLFFSSLNTLLWSMVYSKNELNK